MQKISISYYERGVSVSSDATEELKRRMHKLALSEQQCTGCRTDK